MLRLFYGEIMDLVKETWTENDIINFKKYLLSFSKGEEKGKWEKRILNTKLPCIAVPSQVSRKIIKEISKGNFLSFIDFWLWENYTESMIVGNLICYIKDFDVFEKYLIKYANKVDNWANCDCLKFKINLNNKDKFFNLAKKLIKNKKPFVKRVGLIILFKLVLYKEYLNEIFNILNSFKNEEHYYVNMMLAWLLSECFVKYREETLNFLKTHNLNKFVINKGISKCRDSFRVSKEDKEFLLRYKVK